MDKKLEFFLEHLFADVEAADEVLARLMAVDLLGDLAFKDEVLAIFDKKWDDLLKDKFKIALACPDEVADEIVHKLVKFKDVADKHFALIALDPNDPALVDAIAAARAELDAEKALFGDKKLSEKAFEFLKAGLADEKAAEEFKKLLDHMVDVVKAL